MTEYFGPPDGDDLGPLEVDRTPDGGATFAIGRSALTQLSEEDLKALVEYLTKEEEGAPRDNT